jgi:hypothetical protein
MTKKNVTPEELDSTEAQPLPDREAMSILPIDPSGSDYFTLPIEPTNAVEGDGAVTAEPLKGPAE